MTSTEYKTYIEQLKSLADGTKLIDCFDFVWVKEADGIYSIDGGKYHPFYSLFMPHGLHVLKV